MVSIWILEYLAWLTCVKSKKITPTGIATMFGCKWCDDQEGKGGCHVGMGGHLKWCGRGGNRQVCDHLTALLSLNLV